MQRLRALVVPAMLLFNASAVAQERGIEVHGGAGYVFDAGEGPSVPTISAGVVGWVTRGWGVGVRLIEGVANDYYDEPIGTTLGPGDLRMWTLTSQWRWFARATEVNLGLGAGGYGYRYHRIRDGRPIGDRSGSGFVAIDLLFGRRVTGPLHLKGGFTYALAGDAHGLQPVVLLAWKP